MMAAPDDAECWICLEGGDDEAGNPLVCDCSCRGDSAGFAHLSCLGKYAEQICEQSTTRHAFDLPWEICPNCKQRYQNDLALDMANAFVSFAEMSYGNSGNSPEDKMRVISSLQSKIETCDNIFREQTPRSDKHGTLKVEIETLIKKILSMVDQTKKDLTMNR